MVRVWASRVGFAIALFPDLITLPFKLFEEGQGKDLLGCKSVLGVLCQGAL